MESRHCQLGRKFRYVLSLCLSGTFRTWVDIESYRNSSLGYPTFTKLKDLPYFIFPVTFSINNDLIFTRLLNYFTDNPGRRYRLGKPAGVLRRANNRHTDTHIECLVHLLRRNIALLFDQLENRWYFPFTAVKLGG